MAARMNDTFLYIDDMKWFKGDPACGKQLRRPCNWNKYMITNHLNGRERDVAD
jgi:hypothetical protein